MPDVTHPIEGQIVVLAGAQASVPLSTLSELIERTQRHLVERRATYERRFERIDGTDDAVFYLVDDGRWETIGEALGFDGRELDAVRRTHESQLACWPSTRPGRGVRDRTGGA